MAKLKWSWAGNFVEGADEEVEDDENDPNDGDGAADSDSDAENVGDYDEMDVDEGSDDE